MLTGTSSLIILQYGELELQIEQVWWRSVKLLCTFQVFMSKAKLIQTKVCRRQVTMQFSKTLVTQVWVWSKALWQFIPRQSIRVFPLLKLCTVPLNTLYYDRFTTDWSQVTSCLPMTQNQCLCDSQHSANSESSVKSIFIKSHTHG